MANTSIFILRLIIMSEKLIILWRVLCQFFPNSWFFSFLKAICKFGISHFDISILPYYIGTTLMTPVLEIEILPTVHDLLDSRIYVNTGTL